MSRRRALLGIGGIQRPTYYFPLRENLREVFTGNYLSLKGTHFMEYKTGMFGDSLFFNQDQPNGTVGTSGWANTESIFPKIKTWNNEGDLPFSLSVWLKKEQTNGTSGVTFSARRNVVFGLIGTGDRFTKWCFSVDPQTDEVMLSLNDDNEIATGMRATTIETITRNEWNLVQVNYDGNKGVEMFINNVQVSTTIIDTGYDTMSGGKNPYGLGLSSHSHRGYANMTFLGGMADLGFWNGYNLTEKDRKLIWNNGIGRKLRNVI